MVQKIAYPGPWDDWARTKPQEVGMNASRLEEAIGYAKAHETSWSRNMAHHFDANSETHSEPIGPIKDRGEINGLILRHGVIVAEWGDTRRVDMTFSHWSQVKETGKLSNLSSSVFRRKIRA